MSVDFFVTACNVATLLVLVGTALAAVVQFGHVRAGNELQAVLAIERGFAADDLQAALIYVQEQLPQRLADPVYRAELTRRGYIDPRLHPEMVACNWFSEMGTLIAGGFVNEEMFLNSFGRLVEYYWLLLAPVIALLRRERGDDEYATFEFLVYLAKRRHDRQTSGGMFPAGVARLQLDDPWLSADSAVDPRASAPPR